MSGIIFVVLAIGWAVYLLPKALKHHDDVDRSRPVEEFSDSVRVLGRGAALRARAVVAGAVIAEAVIAEAEAPAPAPVRSTVTRAAARHAARRRRRVLALLLTTLVAVSVTSYLGYTPWATTAGPAVLIVAFLVVARLAVRAQQVRVAAPVPATAEVESVEMIEEVLVAVGEEADLGNEDTQGLSRDELAAAVAEPVLDEGGLWDPLPVTLPTYVGKPRARRTVRTIELTGGSAGITSSGHDAADTALAQEAAAAAAVEAPTAEATEERKVAGA